MQELLAFVVILAVVTSNDYKHSKANTQTVTIGDAVNLGTITRRSGNLSADEYTIYARQPGYYEVDAEIVFTGTVGAVVVEILEGDKVIGSGTATIGTANTEAHTMTIISTARVNCCGIGRFSVRIGSSSVSTPKVSRINVRVRR